MEMRSTDRSNYFDAYVDNVGSKQRAGEIARTVVQLPGLLYCIPQGSRLKLLFAGRQLRDQACQQQQMYTETGHAFQLRNGQPPWTIRRLSIRGWGLGDELTRLEAILGAYGEIVEDARWSTWEGTDVRNGTITLALKVARDLTLPSVLPVASAEEGALRISYRGQATQCYRCLEFGHVGRQCPMKTIEKKLSVCRSTSSNSMTSSTTSVSSSIPNQEISMPTEQMESSAEEIISGDRGSCDAQIVPHNFCRSISPTDDVSDQGSTTTSDGALPSNPSDASPPSAIEPEPMSITTDEPVRRPKNPSPTPDDNVDINEIIANNSVNIRPPETDSLDRWNRQSPTRRIRKNRGTTESGIRMQVRHVSASYIQETMCIQCYIAQLQDFENGQGPPDPGEWICCHGWEPDENVCNCERSREAIWLNRWLFCTCTSPSENFCCHSSKPPCWVCLAMNGSFHNIER